MSTERFDRDIAAIDSELDRRSAEIERIRNEWYRSRAEHERFVNSLYVRLQAEEYDEALDLVRTEYIAIHGPND